MDHHDHHPDIRAAYRRAAAGLALLDIAAWDDHARSYPPTATPDPLPRLLTVHLAG